MASISSIQVRDESQVCDESKVSQNTEAVHARTPDQARGTRSESASANSRPPPAATKA